MRALRKNLRRPRWLAVLLCVCIILPYLNGFTLSAQLEEGEGLCDHHPTHTEQCGYREGQQGSPCNHQHDETCGYREAQPEIPCDKGCGMENPSEGGPEEGDASDAGPSEEETQQPEEQQPGEGEPGQDQAPAQDTDAKPGELAEDSQQQPEQQEEETGLPQQQTPLAGQPDQPEIRHEPDCAYRPAQPEQPCNHQHDETCGYQPAQSASPCKFVCEKCSEDTVQSWEYLDEEEVLTPVPDTKLWGLGVPGVSQQQPLTAELLEAMLPAEIRAQLGGGKRTDLPITWDLSAIPEQGLWQGMHTLQASLPEDYRLAQDAPALTVLLAVGEGQELEVVNRKFMNQWSFIDSSGVKMQENVLKLPVANVSNSKLVLQELKKKLPKQISAWTTPTNIDLVGIQEIDKSANQVGMIMDQDGQVKPYSGTVYWGKVNLSWDNALTGIPSSFQYNDSFTVIAETVANPEYAIYVNANDKPDGTSSTLTDSSILSLTVVPVPVEKYVNQWSFLSEKGATLDKNVPLPDNTLTIFASKDVSKEDVMAKLPKYIQAWGFSNGAASDELVLAGFEYQGKAPGIEAGKPEGEAERSWGTVGIEFTNIPDGPFELGKEYSVVASTKSTEGHSIIVNSNEAGGQNSANDPNLLTLKIRIMDLESHTVQSVEPENVKVNLFDYWVNEDYGEKPTAPKGDILTKSDLHYRPKVNEDTGAPITSDGKVVMTDSPVELSNENDWNQGINKGHLLLFGDGVLHAGLWNKGAGQNTEFGKAYAGMEQIVKSVLGSDGYPEMNLSRAKEALSQGRDMELVRDYKLAGDHDGTAADTAYTGKDIQNLSNTLIGLWEVETGQNIDDSKESLSYLFNPEFNFEEKNNYRKAYTDVKGLFQLDDKGYYYYNMRQNFAEFQENKAKTDEKGNTSGQFILYKKPATWRTDHGTNPESIGNFFPFNKGEEVFNGLDAQGNLTSSVSQSYNTMNHHFGMTVEVDFRQPSNGEIKMGSGDKEPMTFGFSGDDDVWVFVDDVLVLDIGGVHSELYGTIDFSTGDVYIGRAFDTKGIPKNPADPANMVTHTTLKKLYDKAIQEAEQDTDIGKAKSVQWATRTIKVKDENGNDVEREVTTFSSNSVHTLKMFYLERGNYDSSIALRFNLQPLLYQQIKKVDQNGEPLKGAKFELYQAKEDSNGTIIGTNGDAKGKKYLADETDVLATLESGADGIDQFIEQSSKAEGQSEPVAKETGERPFNFADRKNDFYILRETEAPDGYRKNPVDILLQYHHDTDTITVVNRWTTGVVSSFTDHIAGNSQITYGRFNPGTGDIEKSDVRVSVDVQKKGLIMAVPMIKVEKEAIQAAGQDGEQPGENQNVGRWKAMYGSNLGGYHVVAPAHRTAEDWRKALLKAALYQCVGSFEPSDQAENHRQFSKWYLNWNGETNRLEGKLEELPGMAEQYQFNYEPGSDKFNNANMKMAYAIISPEALQAIGVSGGTSEELYQAMAQKTREVVGNKTGEDAEEAIDKLVEQIYGVKGTTPGEGTALETEDANKRGISFLNVGQFTQNAQSMIYIPNEQRELRVWKVDQDGKGVNGAVFGLYRVEDGIEKEVCRGVTDTVDGRVGVLIFSPHENADGYVQTTWANAREGAEYYLKEISAPDGYQVNETKIPVKVGQYSIYADAGEANDGVKVMASVGKLAQTMLRFAISEDMDITLRDITAFAQSQPSGNFQPGAEPWTDILLNAPVEIQRFMHLHYGQNATVDYGLHDEDGGENLYPVFVTDEGYIRARVEQNWPALNEKPSLSGTTYGKADEADKVTTTANKEQLADFEKENEPNIDITNLFSLINVVVVTDPEEQPDEQTGQLTIRKTVEGEGLEKTDYTKLFQFRVELKDVNDQPLKGDYQYYFYGEDKSGELSYSPDEEGKIKDTILLHHDESVTILGLPVGTQWTVTEVLEDESYAEWHPTPASGVISGVIVETSVSEAHFTNRKEPSLEIKKIVSGYDQLTEEEKATEFTLKVKFVGIDVSQKYSYTKFNGEGKQDGTGEISSGGQVKLKHNESIVIHGLPVDTQCTVEEIELNTEVWNPVDPITKPIEAGHLTTIEFTNFRKGTEPKTGDLTIEKTLAEGVTTGMDTAFEFIVTLTKNNQELAGEFQYDGAETGKIKSGGSIFLKPSQKITIHGLPVGVRLPCGKRRLMVGKSRMTKRGPLRNRGAM